jgi:arylsulfatase A-like enzyme
LIAGLALAAALLPAAATSQVSDDGPSAKTLGRLLSRILDCETVRLRAEGRGVCDAGLEGPARTFIEDSAALAFGALLDADPRPDLSGLSAQRGCQREIGRSVARIAKAALVGLDRSGSIRGAPGRSVVDALAAACEAPVAGLAAGLTLPMVGDQCAAAIGPPGAYVDVIALATCLEPLIPVWADRADGDAAPLRPNIVVIVTDDQRWDAIDGTHTGDGIPAMAAVMDRLAGSGVRFDESFVTTPVCTPSRGGLLTGQLAHRNGLKRNELVRNGEATFDDRSTLATWLHDAGYRTGHYGKYMNQYRSLRLHEGGLYAPPGWDDWRVFDTDRSATYFDYPMVENDRRVPYGSAESDYSTDVLARQALRFIEDAVVSGEPFFVLWNPAAPHNPLIPAPRHEGLFLPIGVLPPLDAPSYFEEDVSDKPAWIRALSPFSELAALAVEVLRIRQLQMLQAVDEFVDDLMDRLEASGVAGDTIVVFTSDNGFTWAEHRWVGKACTYEECLRVPLVVRYPRLAPLPRADDALALNIDLAPTLAELAGAEPPIDRDGRSLVRTLDGTERDPPETFHFESFAGTRFSFAGIREARWKFSEYAITGERELYDLLEDPHELENLASDPDQAARVQAFRERILERRPGWPNDLD